MAEDFNDLIDQTETRAQALVIEADKAIELLNSVDAMVDNLSSTIEESANEAKESFDTLTEQITTAEDTLQTQQEAAKESMNVLMQQVQETGGRIQESLTNAFNKFSELQAKKQEFLGEVGEEIGKVGKSFEESGEECDRSEDNLIIKFENFEETVDRHIDALSSNLEGNAIAENELSDRIIELLESINSFDSIIENSDSLLEEIDSDINKSQNILMEAFVKTVNPEASKFMVSVEDIGTSADLIAQTLLNFSSESEDMEDNLNQKIISNLAKGIHMIEHIKSFDSIISETNQTLS